LLFFRCIKNAFEVNIPTTEKEIEIPLGTWLSHAPFRLKKVEEKSNILVFYPKIRKPETFFPEYKL